MLHYFQQRYIQPLETTFPKHLANRWGNVDTTRVKSESIFGYMTKKKKN